MGEHALKIYSTLSREKAIFEPLTTGQVKMYVCGVTVYDYCHIGHARVMVAFDVISRYLRECGYDVTYVRNITDIDDKIIQRAHDNGEPIEALTARMISAMHEDERRLGVLPPDQEPRATAHIDDIIAMVQTLVDKGYAYPASNGDVYYRVRRFEGYGKLTNRQLDDLQAGARVEVDELKEDPLDFVLWKGAKQGEVAWASPWGEGRPGWHIECSAMSTCCLGNTFDIHGGGPDLPFPHHENEIAQSEAATGQAYANIWMHAGAVRVDKEKMSKSLGNFFTIREVLEQHDPEVVRYLLVASHYRSSINYAATALDEARKSLERFYNALAQLEDVECAPLPADPQWRLRFMAAMDDDFNTPEALAVLFDLVRQLNSGWKQGELATAKGLANELVSLGGILGLLQQAPQAFLQQGKAADVDEARIEALIAERAEAKQSKNFARADEIRDQLAAEGVILKDGREGTRWTLA